MQKRNGFTLIEILIAIFILATVLTTVYAAYTGTFRIERIQRMLMTSTAWQGAP